MAKLKSTPGLPEMEKKLGYTVDSMGFAGIERFYSDLKPVPNDKLKQFLREYKELVRRDQPKSVQDLVSTHPRCRSCYPPPLILTRSSRVMDAVSSLRG